MRSRHLDQRALFYERMAGRFEKVVNVYDMRRRLRIVFDRLLPRDLRGLRLLDTGSGPGWFSAEAARRGADVVSLDVGAAILSRVASRCAAARVVGSVHALPFAEATFDCITNTEVIEHVVEQQETLAEFRRVLRRGGVLALTTPNRVWHWALHIAHALRVRPYHGYEIWIGYHEMRARLEQAGFIVEEQFGFHLFPFVARPLYPLLSTLDVFGRLLGPFMLNQALRARKRR